jgi:aspartate kinase
MIVMKFGGSSLANPERIKAITKIVKERLAEKPILVFSAMGDTTDDLLEAADAALKGVVNLGAVEALHRKTAAELGVDAGEIEKLIAECRSLLIGISLIRELSPRTKDCLVSFGERLAVRMLAGYFNIAGIPAKAFDAWDIGMSSTADFTQAEILPESEEAIRNSLGFLRDDYRFTPCVTGFIAKEPGGSVTTLGRGGSDLTAGYLGASLGVDEIQVWKDVDGILSADPRLVKGAKPVPVATFDEAAELAYFGAQVLHPRSVLPAQRKGIPVRVKNSYNPDHPGTLIVQKIDKSDPPLRAITMKSRVTLVDIVSTRMLGNFGFLSEVFRTFASLKISVDMVATSEVSVSLTLDARHDTRQLRRELEKIATVSIKEGKSIVTLVGDVRQSSTILETSFKVLSEAGINVQMISQGASKVNISFIVDDKEAPECVRLLHARFYGKEAS